jgi:AraC-like DNA-binding protein
VDPPSDLLSLLRVRYYMAGGFDAGGDWSLHFDRHEGVKLAGDHADILLRVLPPIVRIYKEADKAMLRWCVDQMMHELRKARPGNSLVIEHLAHMMLVQALRLHVDEGPVGGAGWLFALADKQVSIAIKCMHDDPARRWTVRSLADAAAMSRTTFTLRFKRMVGAPPMEYLTYWRMLIAADKLSNSRDSISIISAALGYESESAFSTAFKRVMGCSPRAYSRHRNLRPDHTKQLAAVAS